MAMRAARPDAGFTLLELTVVLVVASLLFMVGGPSLSAMQDSMDYRSAVRDLYSGIKKGHRQALATGSPVDLLIDADNNRFALTANPQSIQEEAFTALAEELQIEVTYAQEMSPGNGWAAIRFFPEGGASGGDIRILRPTGVGVELQVDWLLADVTQSPITAGR